MYYVGYAVFLTDSAGLGGEYLLKNSLSYHARPVMVMMGSTGLLIWIFCPPTLTKFPVAHETGQIQPFMDGSDIGMYCESIIDAS